MKIISQSILTGVGVLAFAAFLAQPLQSQAAGTDILHYDVSKSFASDGELAGKGSVKASLNEQGKADNQKLDVAVTGLNTNAPYQLVAVVSDDTNLVSLADFVTDSKGGASFHFQNDVNGNGGGNTNGNVTANALSNSNSFIGNIISAKKSKGSKSKLALPDGVNPLTIITEVAVLDPNSTNEFPAVLTADLTQPDKLQYLIKRDLGAGGVTATLQIKATATKTQFRLAASGLEADSDYQVVLNGTPVQTNTTDAKGRLSIKSLEQDPGDILGVQSVELWDASNNVILSTTLP
jgi:hypothetical protein